jgi:hypothetical protein
VKRAILTFAIVALVCGPAGRETVAGEPRPLSPQRMAELRQRILPQPGENRIWEISWLEDIWEARQQAAAAGKPIFVWGGSEGAPITNC